jgi:hypothetical protein
LTCVQSGVNVSERGCNVCVRVCACERIRRQETRKELRHNVEVTLSASLSRGFLSLHDAPVEFYGLFGHHSESQ